MDCVLIAEQIAAGKQTLGIPSPPISEPWLTDLLQWVRSQPLLRRSTFLSGQRMVSLTYHARAMMPAKFPVQFTYHTPAMGAPGFPLSATYGSKVMKGQSLPAQAYTTKPMSGLPRPIIAGRLIK